MASSVVAICNMALGRVGVSIFIDSLTEASQNAQVCDIFYEPCRDATLADGNWNFATSRAVLADLGTPPTNWLYRYALPTDCLSVRYLVLEGSRNPVAKARIPFEVAEEDDVRVLYTDQEEAELVYIKRQENPNLFSQQFISALAWLLASEIAMPLTSSPSIASTSYKMYLNGISQAQAASLREGQIDQEPDCDFITGRN